MAKRGRRARSASNGNTDGRKGKSRVLNQEEKDSKARYEQLRRRRRCVAKKAQELNKLCQMKVFLQITDQTEQRTDYFSTENISDNWPFSWQKLLRDGSVRQITLEGRAGRWRSSESKDKNGEHPDQTLHEMSSPSTLVAHVQAISQIVDKMSQGGERQLSLWTRMRTALSWSTSSTAADFS